MHLLSIVVQGIPQVSNMRVGDNIVTEFIPE